MLLLLLTAEAAAAHLDVKGAVCWVQVLRPADERHPGLIIVTVPQRLTGVLWVSHLRHAAATTQAADIEGGSHNTVKSCKPHSKSAWLP